MNLRKTIKTRTFYDDQDFHDPHQDEVHRAPRTPTEQPVYQGQVAEYNPRLRPAAFPTIPLGQVVRTGEEVTTHTVSESQAISLTRPEVTARANQSNNALKSPILSHKASRSDNALQGRLGDSESTFNLSDMFTSQDQKEWSRRLSPPRSPSLERQISAYDTENPVYTKNLELMERLSKRTDEEWVEAEMATSGEEEEDDEPRGRQMDDHTAPAWDDLPVNVQLDLVDKVMDRRATLDATFEALRLKPQQELLMLNHIQARNLYLDEEQQIIAEVEEETTRRLLTSNKGDLDHFQKSGHRRLLSKHMYDAGRWQDYQTASGKDVALAKSYLTMCGITLSLDHWVNAEIRHDTKATGYGVMTKPPGIPKPLPSIIHNARETVPRPLSSTTTAFPTYPLQKAATPESPTPSGPRLAPQPVNGGSKPTGLLKAPPRRRSTYKQGKPNPPSLYDSAEPTTRSESNPMPQPSNGSRIVEVSPQDQPLQSPTKEPYVPPIQAVPFSLPPQLSSHRQEWLPDGRAPNPSATTPTSQPAPMVPNTINHTMSHGGPWLYNGPMDAESERAQDSVLASKPQPSQNPYRPDNATRAQYGYIGNPMSTIPTNAENTHAPVDAYEQLRQQSSHREPAPPPSLEGPWLNNKVSPMPPPPWATTIGLSSQLYSSISSPLQNPYAMTYHTVDHGTATDVLVTAGKSWQSTAAWPAPATSTCSEDKIQPQRQGFAEASEPALPTPGGISNEGEVRAGQELAPMEEDKDDDYVPVTKGRVRKAPAKASKRRKTTA